MSDQTMLLDVITPDAPAASAAPGRRPSPTPTAAGDEQVAAPLTLDGHLVEVRPCGTADLWLRIRLGAGPWQDLGVARDLWDADRARIGFARVTGPTGPIDYTADPALEHELLVELRDYLTARGVA